MRPRAHDRRARLGAVASSATNHRGGRTFGAEMIYFFASSITCSCFFFRRTREDDGRWMGRGMVEDKIILMRSARVILEDQNIVRYLRPLKIPHHHYLRSSGAYCILIMCVLSCLFPTPRIPWFLHHTFSVRTRQKYQI